MLYLTALLLGILAPAAPAAPAGTSAPARIHFETSFVAALAKADAGHKLVMVEFWADWCGWCHTFERTTFADARVVEAVGDLVSVRIDTEGSSEQVDVARRYGVASLPTILFVTPTGRVVFRLSGYQEARAFARTLELVKAEGAKVQGWERAIAKRPDDGAALLQLGLHALNMEMLEDGRDFLVRARAADGGLPVSDRKRLRLALGFIRRFERQYAEAEALLKDGLALEPADEQTDPQLLYTLGRLYMSWGKSAEASTTLKNLVARFPQSGLAERAHELLAMLEGAG